MEQSTKTAGLSFWFSQTTLEKRLLILVVHQLLGIEELLSPTSVLSAERSGDEWFLSIHKERHPRSTWKWYPAKSIKINQTSLDRCFQVIATTVFSRTSLPPR